MKSLSLAAPKVLEMTTFKVANNENLNFKKIFTASITIEQTSPQVFSK